MKSLFGMLLISVIVIAVSCKKDPDDIILGTGNNTFTDARDGHVYGYVQIGDQIWMSENLAYLPTVNAPASAQKRYFVYGYQGTSVEEARATDNYKTYGVLYTYIAARYAACPDGWHLATDVEYNQLIERLGSECAGLLKATSGWEGETNAVNTTGFTAIPAGVYDGFEFLGLLEAATFWAYNNECANGIPVVRLYSGYDGVRQELDPRDVDIYVGYSIRCVKD